MIACATRAIESDSTGVAGERTGGREGCANHIEVVRTGVNRIRGIDCEIAECRRSSAREGVRSIGSIIDVEDRGKTRTLSERSGVGVVALDRDVRARIVTDGGGAVNLQVVEVLRSRAADRACVIRDTGEYDGGRAAIHRSGARDQVVADGRGCVAEICCRAGVVQREIEEGRVAGSVCIPVVPWKVTVPVPAVKP